MKATHYDKTSPVFTVAPDIPPRFACGRQPRAGSHWTGCSWLVTCQHCRHTFLHPTITVRELKAKKKPGHR